MSSIPLLPYYLVCQENNYHVPIHGMENTACHFPCYGCILHFTVCKSACFFWYSGPQETSDQLSPQKSMGGSTTGVLISEITCMHSVRVAALSTSSKKEKYAIWNAAHACGGAESQRIYCRKELSALTPLISVHCWALVHNQIWIFRQI